MSFFIMGLGQVYAGHIDRGLTLLIIQILSMSTGYSLYSKGLVYEYLAGYLGPAGIVLIVYILLVFLIVLWVYNVKDAYYLALFADFRDWTEIEKVIGKFLGDGQPRLLGHQGFSSNSPPAPQERRPVHSPEPVIVSAAPRPAMARVVDEEDVDLEPPVQPARPQTSDKKKKKTRSRHLTEEKLEELVETERLWRFPARATGMVVVLLILLGGGGYFWFLSHQEIQNQRRPAVSFTADWDRMAKSGVATSPPGLLAADRAGSASTDLSAVAPVGSPVWYESALTLMQSGERSAGLGQLEEGLSQYPAPVEVWKTYLSAKREQDVPEAYEEALGRFLEKYPAEVDYWIILAKCQFDRREHVEASRSLLKALEVSPNHARANYWLGVIYRELNLPDDALAPLLKAVKADPLNAEFNRELGMAYLDQFDRANARRYVMKALSVEPTNEDLKTLIKQIDDAEL
ncbi:MAG TPA: tetratricopeptide repeat protein, partial [Candidatus Ozemobacteraceae bacterium]|nr:tetratricopeptide repeat protein [Candidatus Ozemobacteraceae bacterium]